MSHNLYNKKSFDISKLMFSLNVNVNLKTLYHSYMNLSHLFYIQNYVTSIKRYCCSFLKEGRRYQRDSQTHQSKTN